MRKRAGVPAILGAFALSVALVATGPISIVSAATSGRVYKRTIGTVKYCVEATIALNTSGSGTVSTHSSTSCSTASAVGSAAGDLQLYLWQWRDPEKDGTFEFCGSSGTHANPVGNTWSFTVFGQYCPNPAGTQNFYSQATGSKNPANSAGTQESPKVTT
ncbi:MAG: hypothetical protein ABMA25_00605 [Ilumatobacteraceae bacterium]